MRLFYSLNIAFISLILFSIFICTSLFEDLPWGDPMGFQIFGILYISLPGFLVVGSILILFTWDLKFPIIYKSLPFLAVIIFGTPLYTDLLGYFRDGSINTPVITGVIILGCFLIFANIKGILLFRETNKDDNLNIY